MSTGASGMGESGPRGDVGSDVAARGHAHSGRAVQWRQTVQHKGAKRLDEEQSVPTRVIRQRNVLDLLGVKVQELLREDPGNVGLVEP